MNDTSALVHTRLMARSGAERFLMGVRMHEAGTSHDPSPLPTRSAPD